MHKIIVGDPIGDNIELIVFGRSHPECSDFWDGNWMKSEAKIKCGAFNGHVKADLDLRLDEFKTFLKPLKSMYKTLKGTAKYSTLEEWLEINVSGDGRGHISIKGYIIDGHCDGNELEFNIQTDQTCLQKTIKDIEELLKEYPVRK